MSPINQCKKDAEKLQRQINALKAQLDTEKTWRETLLRTSAKEKLYTIMYASMFKSVLASIEEDIVNARTASEARQWVSEIIDRFRPAFEIHHNDQIDPLSNPADMLGIAFDRENLRNEYEAILKEMREQYRVSA